MKAHLLHKPAAVNENPLQFSDIERPIPDADSILVEIHACGVCHTDLHVVEGELPNPKKPLIPGHEIVGYVTEIGAEVQRFKVGDRVGIPWLHHTDQTCDFCEKGQENLCPNARFTGYTANGGYAEYVTVPADYAVPIPARFNDIDAAPLLCAGVVGYRSIRLSDLEPGERLGIYGFGASGHICIQIARHWNCEVYVFTRGEEHRQHAVDAHDQSHPERRSTELDGVQGDRDAAAGGDRMAENGDENQEKQVAQRRREQVAQGRRDQKRAA